MPSLSPFGAGTGRPGEGHAGPETGASHDAPAAACLWARGVVQGVGFRPFIYTLAREWGVRGWVRNTSAGVEIHVEGDADAVDGFVEALPREAPPRSYIASLERSEAAPEGHTAFTILESSVDPDAYQLVSPDIAICDDCRRELLDPADRRHDYPFTNCTNCGPRFTIIESLPYDRERTTMRHFPLCPACRKEYEDPLDRRFHAEPNACPVCGPRVRLLRAGGGEEAGEPAGGAADGGTADGGAVVELAAGDEADPAAPIRAAAELLRRGEILAVKGLGGFHLACDATDGEAVRRLKRRKGRPHKPLAVMLSDLDELRRHCLVDEAEAALLESPEHPIVLLRWREVDGHGVMGPELGTGGAAGIDPEVAVGQSYLGAMLPYTPLHLLLLRAAGRPLVMTSGNLAEEPIVKGWEEAGRLRGITDAYLVHDREIAARYDDSVAAVERGRTRLLRRSRGYAPFPVLLPRALPQVLACGAELKNTFCLTRDTNAFLSQHIGDLENLETVEHYETSIALYERLFGLEPEVVAYDLHPEYLATKHALSLPQETKSPTQHHHAHIAARMIEHGITEPVIGVSLDGLGYGDDGLLWGGEVFVCDLLGYRRVAHLEPLPLAGGAAAIERPWRTALGWSLALLGDEGLERAAALLGRGAAEGRGVTGAAARVEAADDESASGADRAERPPTGDELATVAAQVRAGVNAPLTTSCGRLFDAVAALAGVRGSVTYEGQAAIELEMMSRAGAEPYPYTVEGDVAAALSSVYVDVPLLAAHAPGSAPGAPRRPLVVRLAPLLGAVLDDAEAGCAPGFIGSRLHAAVAALVLELSRRLRDATGIGRVALSGGVFQNRLVSEQCETILAADGFAVLASGLVPANDGGVALGQAAVAGYTELRRRGDLD
ncbi:MAG: carbamoyltransferase HypF [Thermoleophilia bacterium]|nr:carbamoyltransferase HypF [Thermoleophilia bacterium]